MNLKMCMNCAFSDYTIDKEPCKSCVKRLNKPNFVQKDYVKSVLGIQSPSKNMCGYVIDVNELERYLKSKVVRIVKVIFNSPATIVFWSDGTKTVVKCGYGEVFDPEKGLAMACSKKMFGNEGNYYEIFKEWLPNEVKEITKRSSISEYVAELDKKHNTEVYSNE